MNKFFFAAMCVATALVSCSQSEDIENVSENEVAQTPIAMSVYTANSTRAVDKTGNITSAQVLAQKGGFGVFAYSGFTYAAGQTTKTPDFMYNQNVTGTDAASPAWSYSPLKFWPNDNTAADNSGAVGETNNGNVSFFAYAPYTSATEMATNTTNKSGVTAVSANNATGDPTVTYYMDPAGKSVDLLWGTAGDNGPKVSATSSTAKQAGTTLNGGKGAVNANLTKMANDGKVQFVFKHALAKFGGSDANNKFGILIKADLDNDAYEKDSLGVRTKITVSKIEITTDGIDATTGKATSDASTKQKIVNSGTLNLATGVWTPGTAEDNTLKTVVSNGTDGNAVLADAIKEPTTAPAKTDAGFNGLPVGVKQTAVNVYASEATPFLLIPGSTLPKLKVTVTYVVRTFDGKLANSYTETKNVISNIVNFNSKVIELNKRYSLTLILGLNSVKFDATVRDWDNATTGSEGSATADNTDVNLPLNVTTIASSSTQG